LKVTEIFPRGEQFNQSTMAIFTIDDRPPRHRNHHGHSQAMDPQGDERSHKPHDDHSRDRGNDGSNQDCAERDLDDTPVEFLLPTPIQHIVVSSSSQTVQSCVTLPNVLTNPKHGNYGIYHLGGGGGGASNLADEIQSPLSIRHGHYSVGTDKPSPSHSQDRSHNQSQILRDKSSIGGQDRHRSTRCGGNDTLPSREHEIDETDTSEEEDSAKPLPQLITSAVEKLPKQPVGLTLQARKHRRRRRRNSVVSHMDETQTQTTNTNHNASSLSSSSSPPIVAIANISSASPFRRGKPTPLRVGDEILTINNHRVRDPKRAAEMIKLTPPGNLTVRASRGERMDGMVYHLVKLSDDVVREVQEIGLSAAESSLNNVHGDDGLGEREVEEILGELGLGLEVTKDNQMFVRVKSIDFDGAFAKTGLRTGDVILSVDGSPVTNVREAVKSFLRSCQSDPRSQFHHIQNDGGNNSGNVVALLIFSFWDMRDQILHEELLDASSQNWQSSWSYQQNIYDTANNAALLNGQESLTLRIANTTVDFRLVFDEDGTCSCPEPLAALKNFPEEQQLLHHSPGKRLRSSFRRRQHYGQDEAHTHHHLSEEDGSIISDSKSSSSRRSAFAAIDLLYRQHIHSLVDAMNYRTWKVMRILAQTLTLNVSGNSGDAHHATDHTGSMNRPRISMSNPSSNVKNRRVTNKSATPKLSNIEKKSMPSPAQSPKPQLKPKPPASVPPQAPSQHPFPRHIRAEPTATPVTVKSSKKLNLSKRMIRQSNPASSSSDRSCGKSESPQSEFHHGRRRSSLHKNSAHEMSFKSLAAESVQSFTPPPPPPRRRQAQNQGIANGNGNKVNADGTRQRPAIIDRRASIRPPKRMDTSSGESGSNDDSSSTETTSSTTSSSSSNSSSSSSSGSDSSSSSDDEHNKSTKRSEKGRIKPLNHEDHRTSSLELVLYQPPPPPPPPQHQPPKKTKAAAVGPAPVANNTPKQPHARHSRQVLESKPGVDGTKDQTKKAPPSAGSTPRFKIRKGSVKVLYKIYPKIIGTGAFGTVRSCINRHTKQQFAVKSIMLKDNAKNAKLLKSEISLLQRVKHPNIVQVVDVVEDGDYMHIVMEQCNGGDLFDKLVEEEVKLEEERACEIILSLLDAVAYLHDKHIVHRDLKAEHIMLSEKGINSNIKIIDFGLATTYNPAAGDPPMTAFAGSPFTVSPDVIKRKYGKECDLWSVGVITYFLLTNQMPFNADSDGDVFNKILCGQYSFPKWAEGSVSEEARDFVSKLIVIDPQERFTAKQALNHPWIMKAKCKRQVAEKGMIVPYHGTTTDEKNTRSSAKMQARQSKTGQEKLSDSSSKRHTLNDAPSKMDVRMRRASAV